QAAGGVGGGPAVPEQKYGRHLGRLPPARVTYDRRPGSRLAAGPGQVAVMVPVTSRTASTALAATRYHTNGMRLCRARNRSSHAIARYATTKLVRVPTTSAAVGTLSPTRASSSSSTPAPTRAGIAR